MGMGCCGNTVVTYECDQPCSRQRRSWRWRAITLSPGIVIDGKPCTNAESHTCSNANADPDSKTYADAGTSDTRACRRYDGSSATPASGEYLRRAQQPMGLQLLRNRQLHLQPADDLLQLFRLYHELLEVNQWLRRGVHGQYLQSFRRKVGLVLVSRRQSTAALRGVKPLPGFFRFRRSKQILPGVRLNLSKSGMSVSMGPRGAHYTIGPRGTRATAGIPGTGLFYTTYSSHHARRATEQHASKRPAVSSVGPSASSVSRSVPMTPAAKLGWGITLAVLGLLLLAVVWPLAILLLIGGGTLVWVAVNQRKEPKWRVRGLLRQAQQNSGARRDLLEQALGIDPDNPEALAACAEDAYQRQDWTVASSLYERYLYKAPDDEQAELHVGLSYLNAGNLDPALQHLEKIRAKAIPSDRPALFNAVAIAFLKKGHPGQALEILKTLPLRRQNLEEVLQQGLLLRSIAHYGLNQTAAAMSDLDRLYAISPEYPGLAVVRDTMKAGTFSVSTIQFQIS
jgi:tetratricopeptide (TPR) repeat protein